MSRCSVRFRCCWTAPPPARECHGTKDRPWLTALLARRHTKVAAIALANKIARMTWAIMAKGEHYKEPVALAA
jgi:transposase